MTTHCSILQHHVLDAGGGAAVPTASVMMSQCQKTCHCLEEEEVRRDIKKKATLKKNQRLVGRGNVRLEGWWAFLSEGVKLRQDNKGRKKERNTPFRSNTWHSVGVAATRKLLQSVSISGSVRKHDRTFLGTLRGTEIFFSVKPKILKKADPVSISFLRLASFRNFRKNFLISFFSASEHF